MNFSVIDLLLVSPMLVLLVASVIPLTIKVLRGNVEQAPLATLIQGLIGVLAAMVLLFVVSGTGAVAFGQALIFDGLTKWIGLIALLATAASMVVMYENPATRGDQFSETIFLTMGSAIGMLILASAADLLVVFIGIETMSLALYLMIAVSHEQKLSKEASFKYFVLGGFASALFLYGISFIFGSVGSTFLSDIIEATPRLFASSQIFIFGMALIVLGFCFKVSIAPFHAWTPDVYEGAPTPHTGFMATAVKTVSFAAFIRVIAAKSLVNSENLLDVLQWLAVITILVGNTAAILQSNMKRMLAYSSVAHSGYLLIGVITIGVSDNLTMATSGVLYYLLGYTLMTLGAFAIVSLIEKNENSSISVEHLASYSKRHPYMAFSLTIFLLSLAGIPPTVGFFGKFYIFTGALGEGLIWMAIWGVLGSVISAYYYLRPVVVMYMKEGEGDLSHETRFATRLLIGTSAVLVVLLGIASGPVFAMFERAL